MELDLLALKDLQPMLPAFSARDYAMKASIALLRQGHEPRCSMVVVLHDEATVDAVLLWRVVQAQFTKQFDGNRITEDGAEGVALALVKVARGWTIRRRLQRGEFADWLLRSDDGSSVALEVSGLAEGRSRDRLSRKLQQVAKSKDVNIQAACVVAFGPPEAVLAQVV
jgi:hypothetical protein